MPNQLCHRNSTKQQYKRLANTDNLDELRVKISNYNWNLVLQTKEVDKAYE